MAQATWNELMEIEYEAMEGLEAHERIAAYDLGAWTASDPHAPVAVPDGCPFPDDFVDGFCDELQAQIDKAKGNR